jgi:glycosyltransferase involved in cell wall biosynthesis
MTGQRSDPERWFAAADILVHTPRIEAFGLVLIQAMASGAPVAATAVGGIPEIVVQDQTGILGDPNDLEPLSLQLADLLNHREHLSDLASGALERARAEYDSELFARRHAQLYTTLLGITNAGKSGNESGL